MNQSKYQPIIGLEVHVELATKSKMFCGCPAEHFGVEPNTHTCPVCLGLPGALPVPNKKAVEWTILLGLACGCKVNETSKFDRKNYFYPDLPKGFQISQYDEPLCESGKVEVRIMGEAREIRVRRVHLEEDTGKLQHAQVNGEEVSLVDFNRSGVPLVEIVTEPDFRSIEEVDNYLKKLQKIIRYLGISGADMEKGSMRLEPSISVLVTSNTLQRASGDKLPTYRVELKNINSFRFARKALEFEIQRQIALLEKGEMPTQQTRGWSEAKNATFPQREKEGESDYRYFPEPDIPPMRFDEKLVSSIQKLVPELPDAKSSRYQKDFGLTQYTSDLLAEDKSVAEYFEETIKVLLATSNQQLAATADIANWIVNKKVDITSTVPAQLVQQVLQVKQVSQVDEQELEKIIDQALAENPKAVKDYRTGNIGVLGYLIGATAKKIKAEPNTVRKKLIEKIAK